MPYKANEFKNVAFVNKKDLMKKTVIIPIGDNDYKFKISGLGQKAIKLENYFYYGEIIKKVQNGVDDGLEYLIEQLVIDPTNKEKIPNLESSQELKLRASANKQSLRRMSVEAFVGEKEYEFRIAGIGGRSIKVDIYVGYDDIANELNAGNEINLEFILKEILVGNDVDYSVFDDVEQIKPLKSVKKSNDEPSEVKKEIKIEKLSSKKSKEIISKIEGIQKLIFDSIDDVDSDVFTIEDVLEQDRIKSYAVQGKSFEPIIVKNLGELIDLGIIAKGDNENYYKLW